MKWNPMDRIRNAFSSLRTRASESVRRFSKQTNDVLSEEPIDFSSPSIPYYENIADRLGFVRIILYMVLLVFVVGTVVTNHSLITYENLYYLGKDISAATLSAQSQADYISYPVSSSDADFAPYRGGIAIAGSEVVTAMSGSGKQTLSVNVAYPAPIVRTSDKYIVTFSRGGKSFSVYNAFVQVHREDTEFPVFDAVVADNGNFAIVTRSRDYTTEVVIYDDNMKKAAAFHLDGYVTGLSMNREGSALGVVSVEAENGTWMTKVSLIRLGRRISEESLTFPGSLGSHCAFTTDERLAVTMQDRLMVFKISQDISVIGENEFNRAEPALCAIGNGQIAVYFRAGAELASDVLEVYDRNGHSLYTMYIDANHAIRVAGGADQLAWGEDQLYIRSGDTLFRLSENGQKLASATISRDTVTYLPDGDGVLICTTAYAHRLDEGDFVS